MNTATIYKIDRLNTHNGPGFRTVIYFKGCPLHCIWCHNPEGIKKQKQVWVNQAKCIGCQECFKACGFKAIDLINGKISVDQDACIGCQICAEACPAGAMERIGRDYTVDELMETIVKDKNLFDSSGGGVTVTGGEPGMYSEFVADLFKKCKDENIQTAFDTSGAVAVNRLGPIIANTDILYLDLKIYNNEESIKYTGLKRDKIFETINWLKIQQVNPNLQIEFRTPLVPGITDTEQNLNEFADKVVCAFPNAKWELCMFNDLCEDKYNRLNFIWPLSGLKHTKFHHDFFKDFSKKFPEISFSVTGFVDKTE